MSPRYDGAAYVDQRMGDLRFALFPSALPKNLFRVFAESKTESERYSAEMWIVGSSHVCRFRAGGAALTETLTCTAVLGAEADPVAEASDLSCVSVEKRIGPLLYRIEIAAERSPLRLEPSAEPLLEYAYPSGCASEAQAVTRIEAARMEPSLFEMISYHSYPKERAHVKTRTLIAVDAP